MKISAITGFQTTNYQKHNRVNRNCGQINQSSITSNQIAFKGPKTAFLGALAGGIAGSIVAIATGGLAAGIIPEMIMIGGAMGMAEKDDKD